MRFPDKVRVMRDLMRVCAGTVLLAACADRNPGRVTYAVRDSAGIRIVENTGPAWQNGQEWSIAPDPVLRVGSIDGETAYQFYGIRAVDLTEDGGIVVLDGASAELRRYDGRGTHVWSAGGRGGGPGEFQQPLYLGQLDSSFLVWDRAAARLTIMSARGETVSTERHVPASEDPPSAYGVFRDGKLLATFPLTITPPSPGALLVDSVFLWSYDRSTEERQVLARLPGPTWIWTGRFQIPVPLTANPLRAVAGNDLVIATGTEPIVQTFASEGGAKGRFVLPRPASAVRSGDAQRVVDFWIANEYYGAPESVWLEWLDRMPIPTERPAFDRLVVSRTGEIWVRRFVLDPDSDPYVWDILSPDGIYLGEITSPADFEIMAVDEDRIVGIQRDENDVEYINGYTLARPGRDQR
jgi:hypothetical protein